LDVAGLRSLLLQVLEEKAALRAEVAALREENRRLRGLKGPPALKPSKPSGMEKATAAKPRKRGRRGPKAPRVAVEEVVLRVAAPGGSRFKGYDDFVVQDLVIRPRVIRYRRQRWLTPEGATVVAPLPPGLVGHFGPELRRFVLAQYHQGQCTVERLTRLLADIGAGISKRQVQRLLTDRQQGFLAEDRAVLRAGLATAAWISVDDTGARHADRNAICTRIGDHRFASFATTPFKSRLNFLELISGEPAYAVNAEALAYMRKRQLPEALIGRLAAHPGRDFPDRAAWSAHLAAIGLASRPSHPDPARVASEGALWGGLVARGFENTVILSDDAGQFNVGRHALCWVHAERLVHKLDTFCGRQARAKEAVRAGLWEFYRDLKAYCRDPVPAVAYRPSLRPCAGASTGWSPPAPASPPSTGCSPGCRPAAANFWSRSTARRCRCTQTTPRTTCAPWSPAASSPAAPAPTPAAPVATPSSDCSRPAPSSASASGSISAPASAPRARPPFPTSTTSSARPLSRSVARPFAPVTPPLGKP